MSFAKGRVTRRKFLSKVELLRAHSTAPSKTHPRICIYNSKIRRFVSFKFFFLFFFFIIIFLPRPNRSLLYERPCVFNSLLPFWRFLLGYWGKTKNKQTRTINIIFFQIGINRRILPTRVRNPESSSSVFVFEFPPTRQPPPRQPEGESVIG